MSRVSCEGAVLKDGESVVTVSFAPSYDVSDVGYWMVTGSWDDASVQVRSFTERSKALAAEIRDHLPIYFWFRSRPVAVVLQQLYYQSASCRRLLTK